MKDIRVEASDVWDYSQEHVRDLVEYKVKIASNEDYGTSVFITKDDELDTAVYVSVEADEEEVFGKYAVSRTTCWELCEKVYEEYLTSRALETLGIMSVQTLNEDEEEEPPKNVEEIEQEDIDDREADLNIATEDFLYAILGGEICSGVGIEDKDQKEEIIKDLKEHFLEYMARKWGIPIYRPMYLYTEEGKKYYTDYPYEEIIFDDPDNPLYSTKK